MARLYGDEAAEPPLPAESEIQAAVERARQETEPTSAVELTTSRPRAVGPRAGTACSEARSGSGDPPRRRSRLPAVFGLAGAALALGLASFVLFGWSLRDREEVANPTAESAPSEAAPVLPAAAAPVAEPVPGDEPPALPAAGVRQPDQMARPALESPPPETRVRSPAPADKRPALRKHPAQRKALAAPPPAPRAGKIRYGIPVDPFR
jgi:hypothetical protein